MEDGPTGRDTALARITALQQRAVRHGVKLRSPPPEPTTCCGRGCHGCVWDSYDGALTWWLEEASQQLCTPPPSQAGAV